MGIAIVVPDWPCHHCALIRPQAPPLIQPILMAVPLQLLAYHAAVVRGFDIDRPHNLIKSVTVE